MARCTGVLKPLPFRLSPSCSSSVRLAAEPPLTVNRIYPGYGVKLLTGDMIDTLASVDADISGAAANMPIVRSKKCPA